MKFQWAKVFTFVKILIGCIMFALGFDLFLEPNGLNAGGISGLAMVIVNVSGFATVGFLVACINLPLFILAGKKLGKRFLLSSFAGVALSSVFIDMFAGFPTPVIEPLVAALYGGVLCGFGLGMVFSAGASTGGTDIIVRLLKLKWQNVPIGTIGICLDLLVVIFTGFVFRDAGRALYCGIAIFVTGCVVDAVVYRFDYSRVVLIMTKRYDEVAEGIVTKLSRGVTFLHGEGGYTHSETKVILTAVKRQQLAELKALVVGIDSDAFVIVQEAHQVLGDGFSRYSKDSL